MLSHRLSSIMLDCLNGKKGVTSSFVYDPIVNQSRRFTSKFLNFFLREFVSSDEELTIIKNINCNASDTIKFENAKILLLTNQSEFP